MKLENSIMPDVNEYTVRMSQVKLEQNAQNDLCKKKKCMKVIGVA